MDDWIIPVGLRVGILVVVGFTDGYSVNLVGLYEGRADGIREGLIVGILVIVGENDGSNVGFTE